MIRKRIGKDIRIKWTILTNGEPLSLEGRDLALELVTAGIGRTMTFEAHGNSITTVFYGRDQQRLGKYTLTLYENLGKANASVLDSCEGFVLVSSTCQESGSASTVLDVESIDLGSGTLEIGIQGPSAYEVAVQNGFNGTEQEWLDSLKLKYADLTEDEIAQLQKPATDAAAQVKEEVKKLVAATQLDFDTYAQHGKKIIEAAASKAASDVQAFTEAGAGTINDTVAAANSQINAAVQQAGTAASGAETAASEANKAAQDANEQLEAMKEAKYVKAGEGVETAQKATISINGKAAAVLAGTAGELAKLYAPEQAGAEGQVLMPGDGKPQWAAMSKLAESGELWKALWHPVFCGLYGVTYNEDTDLYALNGLTDLTFEDMWNVWMEYVLYPSPWNLNSGSVYSVSAKPYQSRTTVPRFAAIDTGGGDEGTPVFYGFNWSTVIEVIQYTREPDKLYMLFTDESKLMSCANLVSVNDILLFKGRTKYINFYGCNKLRDFRFKDLNVTISMTSCPLVGYSSLEYLVSNKENDRTITLTVHPDTYSYLTGTATPPETVGGTSEQWQALVTAASAKGISFATAE